MKNKNLLTVEKILEKSLIWVVTQIRSFIGAFNLNLKMKWYQCVWKRTMRCVVRRIIHGKTVGTRVFALPTFKSMKYYQTINVNQLVLLFAWKQQLIDTAFKCYLGSHITLTLFGTSFWTIFSDSSCFHLAFFSRRPIRKKTMSRCTFGLSRMSKISARRI